jgi:hypothetical protein
VTESYGVESLGAEELAESLRQAELSLEDVEEERRFTLSQTGMHIGARELARMHHAWERDGARLRGLIAAIRTRQEALATEVKQDEGSTRQA